MTKPSLGGTSPPCPKCNSRNSLVTDSRLDANGRKRRRRTCTACANRFSTYEQITDIITLDTAQAAIKRIDVALDGMEAAAAELCILRSLLTDRLLTDG